MGWRSARTVALVAAALSPGCGSYLLLTVDCEHSVPDEVDTLELGVVEPDNLVPLGHFEISLQEEEAFPVELLIEPAQDNPSPLRIRILARRCAGSCETGAIDVAGAEALVAWEPATLNEFDFPLLEDLP